MPHRGPYVYSPDHSMVACEKYVEPLGWLPFAADMTLTDPYEEDRLLAEDIWNKIQSGDIVPTTTPAPDINDVRAGMSISAIQFRRGMRDYPKPETAPAMFASCATMQDVYYVLLDSESITRDTKEEIEYATRIHRLHPVAIQIGTLVGMTAEQIDDFFNHCSTK